MKKTFFNLDENVAAALSYATFGVFGVIGLIKERANTFIRFHAMQSLITFMTLFLASGVVKLILMVFGRIPVIGLIVGLPFGIVNAAINLIAVLAWLGLSLMAYSGKMVKVPLIGDVVLRQLEKAE